MVHSFKIRVITLLLSALFPFAVVAQQEVEQQDEAAQRALCCEDSGCNARIEMVNLCAKKIKTLCLDSNKINTDELCAALANIMNIKGNQACFNNLCVDNLRVNNFQYCNPYRATIVNSADTVYNLGAPVAFNFISDDPNGNVSTVPYATYTAPIAGYYILSLQMDFNSFNFTTSPILGVPVGNPQIFVNGSLFRENFTPFLTFHNAQRSTFSALISLKAGDVVYSVYNVFAMSDAGYIALAGTGILDGNGFEENRSMFKIHSLSSNCPEQPLCQPCNVPTSCMPCPSASCGVN